jgi:endonuclease-3
MPRESKKSKQERATRIVSTLAEVYPDAHCELNYTSPLELLIATILSAQCTDKQVNTVTAALFERYETAQAFAEASLGELENSIRRIGLFRSKAKNIKACCQSLIDHFDGDVPQTMEHLTSLAGVGRKTANVVLGNAFDINLGVVVDTHVGRLAQRFRLTKETSPEKIEKDLQELVPQAQWMMLSHWLIWHGRRRCSARNPKCGDCELSHLCPSVGKA